MGFFMKALVFDKPAIGNLQLRDVDVPEIGDHEVLVEVKMAGVNPIDHYGVLCTRQVKPMPHIPGTEFGGIVAKVGKHAANVKLEERVVVYPRVFDASCDMCLSGKEMLCRNGGLIGIVTNGGFAEYAAIPANCVFSIPDDLSWEIAASLPVAALTPYHAIREAKLKPNEIFAVFGASGNTGLFAVQIARKFGAEVIAITRKNWVKEYGAHHIFLHENAAEQVQQITDGHMADVVLNSIGAKTWPTALRTLALNGRLVFFGILTGDKTEIPLAKIYNQQIKIIGSTGGTRKELIEIIETAKELRIHLWKKYRLEDGADALKALFAKERQGRILIGT
jgi:NADPH:quinone reductase-like Zn-dependent oxidoreductase